MAYLYHQKDGEYPKHVKCSEILAHLDKILSIADNVQS